MKSLTTKQWERLWSLEAQFRELPQSEQSGVLVDYWEQGQEDSVVLSLLEHALELPPETAGMSGSWRCGDFTLLELIGEGGFGVVYLAEQQIRGTPRKVALKLVHPTKLGGLQAAHRFLEQEMGTLCALQHEGIVRLHTGGVCPAPDGQAELLYFAMEYLDGMPLDQFMADNPGLPVHKRLALFVRLCTAMEYAHANRVIHCDLKPVNILVTRDSDGVPRPHVLDFGLSWVYGSEDPQPIGCGTLEYMSPEQMDWERYGDLSVRTDIYALGLILFQLLTDRHPFQEAFARPMQELVKIMLDYPPEPLGDYCEPCRGELEHIVSKALAKDPEQRFQRVDALRAAIQGCMKELKELAVDTPREIALSDEDRKLVSGMLRAQDFWQLPSDRVDFARQAFFGHENGDTLVHQLKITGDAWTAADNFVHRCASFGPTSPGKHALGVAIRSLQERVSADHEAELQNILNHNGI